MVGGWGSPLYAALYLTSRRASLLAHSDSESLLRTSSVKAYGLLEPCKVVDNVRVPHGWPRHTAG